MRNTKREYVWGVLLFAISIAAVWLGTKDGLGWGILYAICCVLCGLTFFLEPLQRWRGTFAFAGLGVADLRHGIGNSSSGFDQVAHIAMGIGLLILSLIWTFSTLRKRENELSDI